jgi:NAD(P)-dependent dehydrogenase (short-subunit alcohol dehydrogenase family)
MMSSNSNPNDHNNPPRPSSSLHGRVAIVTGSGCVIGIGNGRAAAILLAEAGAYVVCTDIQPQLAEATVSMIKDEFGVYRDKRPTAISLGADVTDPADCKKSVDKTLEVYGRLDILVNNVGVSGPLGTAVEVEVKEWAKALEINVTGAMLMSKYAIPAMTKNPRVLGVKGSIVNIASVAGLQGGTPGRLLYPTSKGAVVNMTRAMANQHADQGIRVNCVCPGEWSIDEKLLQSKETSVIHRNGFHPNDVRKRNVTGTKRKSTKT